MAPVATSIDEVIAQLGDLVDRSRRERSRLGFFAALYRKVTLEVKEGIAAGRFDDGGRMERLDVTFANRYLDAVAQFRAGQAPTPCWRLSFEAAATWPPIILQHLLLGMNAHINFDLGIAAATVCPRDELPSLKHDFNEINVILAGLVGRVQSEIDRLSPWIRVLGQIDPRANRAIVNFSMEKAREAAWRVAERLAPVPPAQWGRELAKLDLEVTVLGRLVRRPIGKLFNLKLLVIRSRESSDVDKVIDVLDETATAHV
jgi:uncharacterized protein DUF5995